MRFLPLASITLSAAPVAAQQVESVAPEPMRRVAPALAAYTDRLLFGDVWKRPGLTPRDRSLVTIAALIATSKSAQLAGHLDRALDNGVTPAEIGGTITHLAFYAGWPNAVAATEVADSVFTKRKIPKSAFQPSVTALVPVPGNDGERAATVEKTVTAVSPSLAQLTNGPLFGDLWRRSDLSPRDRSLVTIVALTANGDADQLGFHLRAGLHNGLTEAQLGETMAHLGFYAGWPKAFSGTAALTKLKEATRAP
jgi:alkylhydroperoxidase/carboxymuconolactone decarboxylase family protein YurZ